MKFLWIFLTFVLYGYSCQGLAWNQANSKVLQVDQGSGISSVPNYWKSGDAEVTLTGVAAYADAAGVKPVDCSGGSPAITVARSETAPMYDKQSWLITKPASNVQGQGIAFEFDVDNGIAAVEMMDLMFEYIVGSGTFAAGSDTTNSDLMVYLYDVTAGKLIEPYGGSKLYTSSTTLKGDYRGWFQSTLGSKKYRVCLHQATTSASAYTLKVDAGKVQKSKQVVGTIITEWESYTPTITTSSGTMTNYTASGLSRRVGQDIEIQAQISFTGASGTWTMPSFTMPSGLNRDTSKVLQSSKNVASFVTNGVSAGSSGFSGPSGNGFTVTAFSTTVHTGTAPVSNATVTNAFPGTFQNGDRISAYFTTPIQGWSAGARMSDGYDGRVIAAYGVMTSQQTGINTNNTQVKIQINALGATALDTVAGFDFANNRYIFKSGGSYTIGAGIELLGTNVLAATYVGRVLLTRAAGGSTTYAFDLFNPSANIPFSLRGDLKINVSAGDYIELYLFGAGNNSASTLTVSNSNITHLSISKDSGTPFMSPTALWETHYAGTAGDAIGTSDSLIKFTNKIEDTFGSYNPATGLWTAKGPASCSVSARVSSTVNLATSQGYTGSIHKNGARYVLCSRSNGSGVNANHATICSNTSLKVSTGDTVSINTVSDVATTASTPVESSYFTVSCRQ